MDGFEVAQELKDSPELTKTTIMMLTSSASEEKPRAARDGGGCLSDQANHADRAFLTLLSTCSIVIGADEHYC